MSETDFEGYLAGQFDGEPQEPEAVEVPVEAVVAVEPVEEPVEAEAPQELIFGKYKTVEAAEEGFKNLEREKGRLAQEVGELRQYVEAPAPAPQAPIDPSTVENAFLQNPAAARQAAQAMAVRALQQGDQAGYDQIVETWGEYDQFGALRFDSQVSSARAAEQLKTQIAPQVEQSRTYNEQQANDAATRNVQARHPDFEQVVGDLTDESRVHQILEAGFPMQLIEGATGTQADKEQLLETLYRWVKADQAETVSQATIEAAATTAAENRTTKQQSAVASASSAPAAEGTGEDQELDAFYAYLKAPSPTSWADIRPAGQ